MKYAVARARWSSLRPATPARTRRSTPRHTRRPSPSGRPTTRAGSPTSAPTARGSTSPPPAGASSRPSWRATTTSATARPSPHPSCPASPCSSARRTRPSPRPRSPCACVPPPATRVRAASTPSTAPASSTRPTPSAAAGRPTSASPPQGPASRTTCRAGPPPVTGRPRHRSASRATSTGTATLHEPSGAVGVTVTPPWLDATCAQNVDPVLSVYDQHAPARRPGRPAGVAGVPESSTSRTGRGTYYVSVSNFNGSRVPTAAVHALAGRTPARASSTPPVDGLVRELTAPSEHRRRRRHRRRAQGRCGRSSATRLRPAPARCTSSRARRAAGSATPVPYPTLGRLAAATTRGRRRRRGRRPRRRRPDRRRHPGVPPDRRRAPGARRGRARHGAQPPSSGPATSTATVDRPRPVRHPTTASRSSMRMLSADGRGLREAGPRRPSRGTLYDIAIGDVDGDARPDVAPSTATRVRRATTTTAAGWTRDHATTLRTDIGASGIEVALDVNGDGRRDLVPCIDASNTVARSPSCCRPPTGP